MYHLRIVPQSGDQLLQMQRDKQRGHETNIGQIIPLQGLAKPQEVKKAA